MADNVQTDPGSGGADFATKEISHSGDTVQLQMLGIMGVSGTEGSYTVADINGSAANGLEVDVTRVQGTVTVDGSGVTQPISHAALTELAAALNSSKLDIQIAGQDADVTIADGGNSLTVDNGGTFAVQVDGAALTALQLIDDVVYVDDAVFSVAGGKGVPMMALQTTDSVNAGDVGVVGMSADRRLYTDTQIVGQDADISIDDGGNSITVDNGGTFAVQVDGAALTALQLIDNIVLAEDAAHQTGDPGVMSLAVRLDSGAALAGTDGDYSPLQVDADGNLRVNVAAGSSSGTEYTEDAAAPANPTGPATLLVREDTPSSQGADGDWVAQRATAFGAAYAQIVDSSGNFIDSFGGSGGTAAADDADFTAGTTQGTPAMGVYESSPTSVTDGDIGMVGITATRELRVSIEADNVGIGGGTQYTEDDAVPANPVGTAILAARDDALGGLTPAEGDWTNLFVDANGALWTQEVNSGAILADTANMDTNLGTIAGAVSGSEMQVDIVSSALPSGAATAANQTTIIGHVDGIETLLGTIDADTSALAALVTTATLADNLANTTDALNTLALGYAFDGTAWDRVRGDSTNGLLVNLGSNNDVTLTSGSLTAAASAYRNVDANAEVAIKASAGTLFWIHVMNMTAAVAYVHLYNATTATVNPGTTTPTFTFPIPTQGDTNGAGFVLSFGANGQAFSTAITLVVTTTISGSAGDPGTNGVFVNAGYT